MDLKQIHELIKIINKSNIGEISIEDKDGKVTIKQKEEPAVNVTAAPSHQVYTTAAPSVAAAPVQSAAPAAGSAAHRGDGGRYRRCGTAGAAGPLQRKAFFAKIRDCLGGANLHQRNHHRS